MPNFTTYPELTVSELQEAIDRAVTRIYRNIPEFTFSLQSVFSRDNRYWQTENVQWTTGFWPGEIWLAYERTGDPYLEHAGRILVQSFLARIKNKIDVDHHDMGFLYTPSCVSAYRLTGDEDAYTAAILAADQLMSRWHEKGQFFQAWGPMDSPDHYRLIIDCLLNLGLLYWAAEETGDSRYAERAEEHIATTLANCIREDGSSYHTFYFNPETGEPVRGATHQGYRDDSAWARGQAWAIYGTALSFRYTGKQNYKAAFDKTLAYYLDHLPKNLVPYWDLFFTDGADQPWDSSASAIAICGMLEMAQLVEEDERKDLRWKAAVLAKALIANCEANDSTDSNGLLLHGTYCKKSEFNDVVEKGVDECVSWGDYFYMEALTRLSGNWTPYW